MKISKHIYIINVLPSISSVLNSTDISEGNSISVPLHRPEMKIVSWLTRVYEKDPIESHSNAAQL